MRQIYEDGDYLEKHPTWHQEDSPWKVGHILKMIRDNRLEPKTVCEVGCGAGEILSRLHAELPGDVRFDGYEISPQAFEICNAKRQERLGFFLKDFFSEDAPRYDLALAIDVFEHVEDYYGFLKALRKRAHYKLFHIPLNLSVQTVLRATPIQEVRKSCGHIHYFTKETALATLTDLGYEIVDHFYTSGSIELPKRRLKARLAKLPRKLLFSLNQDLTVRILGGFSLMVLAK